MTDKKIYTREEFDHLLKGKAAEMAADAGLQAKARDVLVEADRHMWIHQTSWMGQPILNLPQDMFALQDIIYRTRPSHIVEIGVAWGGSSLFYATLLETFGKGHIVGVDIFIPEDLRARLGGYGKLSERITLMNGSSVEAATFEKVKDLVGGSREVMVILDSYHTHDHVLQELRLYSELVGPGHYLVCCDTIVEDIPTQEHRTRPWGPGNNPKTAVKAFLAENPRFEVDEALENKLLFSCNPSGYLRCRR